MPARLNALALAGALTTMLALLALPTPGLAQADDAYRPPPADIYRPPQEDAYRPRPLPPPEPYSQPSPVADEPYYPPGADPRDMPGEPYPGPYNDRGPYGYDGSDGTFSSNEIVEAGHRFFGTVTKGVAKVIEYAFQQQGRPNGYILGEDAGGAFIAGVRYGEGTLYTKDAGVHRVYWQGPSIGYDFGGDGSKVMVLVYNLRTPYDIYRRFAGVDGSAYVVGGVGLTFQKNGDVVTAPIRTGVGLRLGANIGYLKYTARPTWNPF